MRIRKHVDSSLQVIFFSGISIWTIATTQVGAADPEVRSFQLMSPGQAHLTLDTPPDQNYSVLISTNLQDWTPAGPLPSVSFDGQTATYRVELNPERPVAAYQVVYDAPPPDPEPIPILDGPGGEPVSQHLPEMGMPRELPDDVRLVDQNVRVSIAHILVTFEESTTVQMFNNLLENENLSIAGAIPIMNVALLRRDNVTDLDDLANQLVVLENSGLFSKVAPNFGMCLSPVITGPAESIPQTQSAGGSFAPRWTWEADGIGMGSGGNNAFELSRIPQLWNWLDYGYRQKEAFGGHDIVVLEFGFYDHRDRGDNVTLGSTINTVSDGN